TQVTASQIMSASEDLSLTLEENSNFMQELYTGAKEINKLNNLNYSTTSEVIEAIKDIVANIEKVRSYSTDARKVGEEADKAISEGMKRIYDIIELIGAIDESSKRTVKYVEKFSGSTKEIAKILKVVHDIARETEILSFNASIESKRAGVEGRGFGVIAGAIRDLAEKSRREVTEIGNVIEDINGGLSTLTENIFEDNGKIEKSVSKTKTVEESLSRMKETFSQLSLQINGIMDASQTQNLLAADVSGKISGVEGNSKRVNEGFNDVYASIKKQRSSMDALNSLGKYLLGSANDMAGIVKDASQDEYDAAAIAETSRNVFGLLSKEVLANPMFISLDPEMHKSILDRLLSNEIIEAAWSNDAKGRFIYSNPPAGIKNAKVRGWFKESITGRNYTSDVYISAITKKPCITVSMPIISGGKYIGVIGADLRLK
ncbi:MAG TPA: methyl-accepting chemotaxis protein, partial [Ruminiclostridium sp.]|nr:methyl-accepting chemotaxis protein [Ruminiclostridium sp.]